MTRMSVANTGNIGSVSAAIEPMTDFRAYGSPAGAILRRPILAGFSCNYKQHARTAYYCVGQKPLESLMRGRKAAAMQVDRQFRSKLPARNAPFPTAVKNVGGCPPLLWPLHCGWRCY